jgi:hypothetical protein
MSDNSSPNSKLLLLAVAAVLLVMLARTCRSDQDPKPQVAPAKAPPAAAAEPQQPQVFDSEKKFAEHQQRRTTERREVSQIMAAGMAPLSMNSKKTFIEFETKALERKCTPGDLDVIEHDNKLIGASGYKLMFSLESLSTTKSGAFTRAQEVTFEQLKAGVKGKFEITPPAKPMVLGLFLCSAYGNLSNRDHICSYLKARNIADLIEEQRAAFKNPAAKLQSYPRDAKVFFFQMLVAGPRGIYIYQNDQTLEFNMDYLERAMDVKSYPHLKSELAAAVNFMREIESLPPQTSGSKVTLLLPHRGDCPYILNP